MIEACDEAVRFIKDCRGREPDRRMTNVKKHLMKSKRHNQSYTHMLRSLVIHFDDVSTI